MEEIGVEFSKSAERALLGIANWFEDQNGPESGERFLNNIQQKLNRLKKSFPYFSPCGNLILRSKGLFCTNYRQWILALELSPKIIVVRAILHKRFLPQAE